MTTQGGIQRVGDKLLAGIVAVEEETGYGLVPFLRFEEGSHRIARAFGLGHVQFYGGLVDHPRINEFMLSAGATAGRVREPNLFGGTSIRALIMPQTRVRL